ncbi:MAG: hypothetical protein HWE22_16590 [Flavobacteriales bacterium]|nr:hypothetical protein [Flavobacteriales bacterium]
MKKSILFGLLIASSITMNSCGESVKESKTVELTGQAKSMTLDDAPIIVAIGEYTDNYYSKKIEDLIFSGQKIVQVEVFVKNNSSDGIDIDLPMASFSLSDGKKNYQINGLVATKVGGFHIYDGEVKSTQAKGYIFFNVDEDVDVETLSLEIVNIMNNDAPVGSLPLKQMENIELAEANTEVSVANNTVEIEDALHDGKGTLTVNKVIDNYTESEDENLYPDYLKLVKVEFTIATTEGNIYCMSSHVKMKSGLLKNAVYSTDYELESGNLYAGEERSGYAIFSVPVAETSFTLQYDGDKLIKLK